MSLAERIDATAWASVVRDTLLAYPLLQVVHIVGIGLFAGALILTDLRLLGLGRGTTIEASTRHLLRYAWVGLALIVVSGLNMVSGFAPVFFVSKVLGLKLATLVVALVLTWALVREIRQQCQNWDCGERVPLKVKLMASASLTLWALMITYGKLLAYIGGKD